MRKIVFLLVPLIALSACNRPEALEFPTPPPDKLECPDEPEAPAVGADGRVTDEGAAQYMRALRGAWQGCKSDVQFLKDWHAALAKAAKKQRIK